MSIEREFLPKANKIGLQARAAMKLRPKDPLCPFAYTAFQGLRVLKLTEIVKCPDRLRILTSTENKKPVFSATTILCPNSKIVLGFVVNDEHSEERQKSNLAHEWGHVLMEHQPQNLLLPRANIHSKREEDEADAVGFAMLLTDEMCLAIAREGYSDAEAAIKYTLSVPAVRMRMARSRARKLISKSA